MEMNWNIKVCDSSGLQSSNEQQRLFQLSEAVSSSIQSPFVTLTRLLFKATVSPVAIKRQHTCAAHPSAKCPKLNA